MSDTPAPMTAERLAEIRADYCVTDDWCLDLPDYAAEVRLWRELFAHIDAQAARIAELERLLDAKITRVDVDAARARAAHAEARIAELEEQVRVEVARKSKLLLAREPVIADVVYEGEKLIDRLKAAEARALAAEAAIKSALGCLDDPTGGTHIEDMRNAAEHLRRALPQPKVTP